MLTIEIFQFYIYIYIKANGRIEIFILNSNKRNRLNKMLRKKPYKNKIVSAKINWKN